MKRLLICQVFILVITLNGVTQVSAKGKNDYRRPFNKRTAPARFHMKNSSETMAGSKITTHRLTCQYSNGILADPFDLYSYKVCVPRGGNWIIYSFNCPQHTYFSKNANRCVVGSPPTTTLSPTTLKISSPIVAYAMSATSTESTQLVTEILASNVSTEAPPPSTSLPANTNNTSPTTIGSTDFDTTTMASTDSLSSEEFMEIFLTHPPHFTSRPPSPPPLITGQLSIPNFAGLFLQERYPHHTTIKPKINQSFTEFTTQKPAITNSNKLTTWQSLTVVSTTPKTTQTTMHPSKDFNLDRTTTTNGKLKNPLEFINSLDKFDEKLVHNLIAETNQHATKRPNRWKPNINSSAFPTRERFPGQRPSIQRH